MKKVEIKDLIEFLKYELNRGASYVEFEGTILIPENGNKVLLTTEKQM